MRSVLCGQADAQTLKTVKDRGALICGVSQGLPGFSNPDDKGNWTGLDVDFCRAIAAAIFNDPTKVKFTPLSAKDRFEPLKSSEIDVLSRNTTWTSSRDALFNFVGVIYYDGQGFMVRKALKVNSALELNGASICAQTGTTTELNLADYFRANNMKYEVVAFGTADETVKAYEFGPLRRVHHRRLAALCREAQAEQRQRPRDPAGGHFQGAARSAGAPWRRSVVRRREVGAVRDAQRRGARRVVQDHRRGAEVEAAGDPPHARRSREPMASNSGLTRDWVVRIVRHVGNYGEVFERNVGASSKLGISRGLNRLWTKGGIQYAPPIR